MSEQNGDQGFQGIPIQVMYEHLAKRVGDLHMELEMAQATIQYLLNERAAMIAAATAVVVEDVAVESDVGSPP
jgi:hypothetical protein